MTTRLAVKKHRRRSAAQNAFEQHRDALTDLWRMDVRVWLGRLPAEVAAQLGNHRPDPEQIAKFELGEFTCGVCVEIDAVSCTCCGEIDPVMHKFPCRTIRAAGLDLPPLPEPATLRDFWDEPHLDVILNHPPQLEPYRRMQRGVPIRVPVSDALQMLGALRTESRRLVESYR